MSDPGGDEGPREPNKAERSMVDPGVEGGRSIGAGPKSRRDRARRGWKRSHGLISPRRSRLSAGPWCNLTTERRMW